MIRLLMSVLPFLVAAVFSGCKDSSKISQMPGIAFGSIERINYPSKYAGNRNIDVWTPPGYSRGTKYPVLYMFDGQMLFDSTVNWNHQEWMVDENMQMLAADTALNQCIIVAIWNTGNKRHAEYFPQKPLLLLPETVRDSVTGNKIRPFGHKLFEGRISSDSFLLFMVKELKPHIDSTYSTLQDAGHTYVMGSSMGGLMSMYAICEYPGVFGKAACLSTHWPGLFSSKNNPVPDAFLSYFASHLPDPAGHSIYFDYGTETLDTMYRRHQVVADSIMSKGGYDTSNWVTLEFKGADHSERAWARRLEIPLRFLLRKKQ